MGIRASAAVSSPRACTHASPLAPLLCLHLSSSAFAQMKTKGFVCTSMLTGAGYYDGHKPPGGVLYFQSASLPKQRVHRQTYIFICDLLLDTATFCEGAKDYDMISKLKFSLSSVEPPAAAEVRLFSSLLTSSPHLFSSPLLFSSSLFAPPLFAPPLFFSSLLVVTPTPPQIWQDLIVLPIHELAKPPPPTPPPPAPKSPPALGMGISGATPRAGGVSGATPRYGVSGATPRAGGVSGATPRAGGGGTPHYMMGFDKAAADVAAVAAVSGKTPRDGVGKSTPREKVCSHMHSMRGPPTDRPTPLPPPLPYQYALHTWPPRP